jgi:hypothetical protein
MIERIEEATASGFDRRLVQRKRLRASLEMQLAASERPG